MSRTEAKRPEEPGAAADGARQDEPSGDAAQQLAIQLEEVEMDEMLAHAANANGEGHVEQILPPLQEAVRAARFCFCKNELC